MIISMILKEQLERGVNMNNERIVFMGTPEFAVPVLTELIEKYNVVLVVSQPDREKDRKGNILMTPTKQVALNYNIDIFQPQNIKDEYEKIFEYKPDIIITCAYGQILPDELLKFPKYGCINIHGSLLPKYRGGAPIHHAIINGETETGITIMYMDSKMDAGDIIYQSKIPIGLNDNLDKIYKEMSWLGAKTLLEVLPLIFDGTNNRIKQDENQVSFGLNITKGEEKINFNQKSISIHNKIRGLSSNPGAYAIIEGKRIKIYNSELTDITSKRSPGTIIKIDKKGILVSTLDNDILFTDIKLEGKKRCLVKDFINGIKITEYVNKKFE